MIGTNASKFLKQEHDNKGYPIQRYSAVPVEVDKRIRYTGSHFMQIAANSSQTQDWKIPQLQYKSQNVPSLFMGVSYFMTGGVVGDKVTLQIIDKDNVLGYGANVVLDEFSKDFYVAPDTPQTIREFQANLYAGLYVRVIYTNTSANQADFTMNLLRLIDTTGIS